MPMNQDGYTFPVDTKSFIAELAQLHVMPDISPEDLGTETGRLRLAGESAIANFVRQLAESFERSIQEA